MTQRFTETFNWPLFGVVLTLLAIGLVNLYSAVSFWEETNAVSLFWNQMAWVGVGLLVMVAAIFFDYRVFKSLAITIYVLVLLLLMISIFFGSTVRGTHGWIQLGPFNLQPAELAKIAYILIAAKYFSDHPNPDGCGLLDLWQPFLFMFIPVALIIYQGDLGSSLFLICIFMSLAFFAGIRRKTLLLGLFLAIAAAGSFYTFGLKPYQRDRIFSFLHPEEDVRGRGYHLMQSKIAVGSGKILGKGYLKGNINKLQYLPERHTDFIFPVLAEEWGFLGSVFALGLYAAFRLMGVEVSRKARDRFGIFLALGIVAMIFWQLVINLGGVLGLIPLTGVTLPLLSYGGSSMVTILMSIGILLSISLRRFMF